MHRLAAIVIGVALLASAIVSFSCNRVDGERQDTRQQLDEEFEAETLKVRQEAELLSTLLDELVANHVELDARHAQLDAALRGVELDAEDRAIQAKHEQWETGHRFLIEQARAELQQFEEAREQHERDEATHADASLKQLREDHERFERELRELEADLAERVHELQLAKRQMDIVFSDHDALNSKYAP